MKTGKYQSKECKTISTNPTQHISSNPAIHSYHQYPSLLRYITSFISDFRVNIAELKKTVNEVLSINKNIKND
jgi:hypothetical protein